jgi:hypothetical protein
MIQSLPNLRAAISVIVMLAIAPVGVRSIKEVRPIL